MKKEAVDTKPGGGGSSQSSQSPPANASRRSGNGDSKRRRCVSTACIACRKRKSKCDGAQPACAACVSVYNTQCIYDPSSDHRRKGVYKKDIDGLKTRNSTLQTLIQAILNYPEEQVSDLVGKIRACESLDKVAESIIARENGEMSDEDEDALPRLGDHDLPTFESELAHKIGNMRIHRGSLQMIGGTSNLLYLDNVEENDEAQHQDEPINEDPITSWSNVTTDAELVKHLLNHYFTWHYPFFTILPRYAFERDFARGKQASSKALQYCSPLLVNAMLALGCHFTSAPGARSDPEDSATAGDHFFNEAKRLIYEEDLLETPQLSTVQALSLMSVREAGCAREARGWVYSGMAFRMACDLGLSFASTQRSFSQPVLRPADEDEEDARRITFWGCFMIDKCWSNYLGRLPMFQLSDNVTVPKFEVIPAEEASTWSPYSESGFSQANAQPSRTRAVALHISGLCDISSDLIRYFYHPEQYEKPLSKQTELKRLSDIHSRLEAWRRDLPKEFEPKEGILSSVIIMHMLFQVLYIHLFRPFLRYNEATSPLPSNVSPRKMCTQAAVHISKLLRLYKRSHGLRQIVNIAVYITHSASTIHLLNLPDKNARRDITHGVKALEEIAEGWLCARRTLGVLSAQARKWNVDLPEEAAAVLSRTDAKFGKIGSPGQTPPAAEATGTSPSSDQRQSARPSLHPTASSAPLSAARSTAAAAAQAMLMQQVETQPVQTNSTQHKAWGNPNETLMQAVDIPTNASGRQSNKRPFQNTQHMFGGVEALLQEGQDWWLRDQSQVASDFDNWTTYASSEHAWPHPQGGARERGSIGGPSSTQQMTQMSNSYGQFGASAQRQDQQQHSSTPAQSKKHRQLQGQLGDADQINGATNGYGNFVPPYRPQSANGNMAMGNALNGTDAGTADIANGIGHHQDTSGLNIFSNVYNEQEWYQ